MSDSMQRRRRETFGSNFRRFFVRGLAIVLPTVLTIWILIAAYGFVQARIAEPINQGVRELLVRTTPFPIVSEADIERMRRDVERAGGERYAAWEDANFERWWIERETQRHRLERWWASWSVIMDLIGLVLAIVLIYMVGIVLGSYIGRRLYHRGEQLINRVPLISRVYPAVKQVTDFFFGEKSDQLKFSRVVAVEYPRKGLWSVGLVTGDTMRDIEDRMGEECLTVFVPSSPTPFTGYVITIPKRDTIELPITVEDAMKFAVSGGVLIPPNQLIVRGGKRSAEPLPAESAA
jgi:uncharacterized membrane protein